MPAVGALAVTLSGLHELVAHDPTVLEGDLPPRSRSAGPAPATEPLTSPSKHQACSGHHAARTCQEMRTHGRKRRILLHDSDFRGKFRIVQHFSCRNVVFQAIPYPRTSFSSTFPRLRGVRDVARFQKTAENRNRATFTRHRNVPKRPEACIHSKKTRPRPSNVCFVIKRNIRNIRIP